MVVIVAAVGEIEPGHIHAGTQQGFELRRLAAGRADRTDDLRSTG
jgi:hypothetical protein